MRIGFIGLGIMGAPMCENIIKKHDDTVYVYNRTRAKAEAVAAKGAVLCESALEVAQRAEVIITMVPASADSRAVYMSILPALDSTKLCIDMSTIDPNDSADIARTVKGSGAEFIDAPVVKSRPAAVAGTLGIYVGGSEEAFNRARLILSYMGENIIRMGDNGSGLVMKICHNALVSQIQNGVNEASALAAAFGIDIMTFAQAISYGGGQNAYLDTKKSAIAAEDYTTAFSVRNMCKDVHICTKLAGSAGVYMPGEENAARVYDEAMEKGLGAEDFCATVKVVRGRKHG